MASSSSASPGGVDADSSSVLLSSLRAVVSGSGADTARYTAREFLRCVVSPRDLHHLRYWLQYEGAENPDRLLSDGNANLTSQQETGATALFLACHAQWEDAVKTLLDAGAEVNKGKYKMTNGSETIVLCTPLMEAVKVNHTGLVKLLIDNGAQVNYTVATHGMKTALEVAVNEGYPECAKILLESGARPKHRGDTNNHQVAILNVILSAVSAYGSCCCDYCTIEVEHGPECTCTEEMRQNQQLWVQVVELMLTAGFDVNQEECLAAASPLYWSVQYRNCKLLQMLIVAGADVDFCSPRFGRTILQYAVEKDNSEAVRILIQNGVNTNVTLHAQNTNTSPNTRWISTLLGVALKSEHYRTGRYLAQAGTKWCKFCRVQLVLFMRSKYNKLHREGEDRLSDLLYLCSLAFQPRTLLELSRTSLRQNMWCLKPSRVRTLPVPVELHDYVLCRDIT